MSDERRRRKLLARADDFDERDEASDISKSIDNLFAIGRWNRRIIGLLAVVLAVNVYLTVRVLSNSNAIHKVCHVEHALWGPVLKANREHPQPNETAQQRQQAATFQHTLDMCKE